MPRVTLTVLVHADVDCAPEDIDGLCLELPVDNTPIAVTTVVGDEVGTVDDYETVSVEIDPDPPEDAEPA